MAQQHTVLVFKASKTPNANDELNWHEFVNLPDLNLATLQKLVGGNLTILPYLRPSDPKFIVYADEEGLLKPDLPRNDLAGAVLFDLGFGGWEFMGMAYAGNLILLRQDTLDERGLDDNDVTFLTSQIKKAKSEWDGKSKKPKHKKKRFFNTNDDEKSKSDDDTSSDGGDYEDNSESETSDEDDDDYYESSDNDCDEYPDEIPPTIEKSCSEKQNDANSDNDDYPGAFVYESKRSLFQHTLLARANACYNACYIEMNCKELPEDYFTSNHIGIALSDTQADGTIDVLL